MADPFAVEPNTNITIQVVKLDGRFRVSLDGQDIYDESNMSLNNPLNVAFRTLEAGDHRIDFTANNHAGKKYDVQFLVELQKPGSDPVLHTRFRLLNSGQPNDNATGKTMFFKTTGGQ